MAVLRTRTARLIALLTLLVGLAHWAGLRWVVSQWAPASKLESFAPPMLTRTLAAHAPQPTPQALKTARRSAAPDHFTYVEPSTDQPRRERKPPPSPSRPKPCSRPRKSAPPLSPRSWPTCPICRPPPKRTPGHWTRA